MIGLLNGYLRNLFRDFIADKKNKINMNKVKNISKGVAHRDGSVSQLDIRDGQFRRSL
tara:strand:- start:17 stop:190 length:174 start_codon:yes stop_codon:yes gene_type:complete